MLSQKLCQRVLERAARTGADYAELFAEYTNEHSVEMIDSRIEDITDSVISGVGIRLFRGLRSVAASTVDMSEAGLMACADSAAEALGAEGAPLDIVLHERLYGDIHPVKIVPSSVGVNRKIAIVKEAYAAAKDYGPDIVQVSANLVDFDHRILVANSEGTYAQDRQIRTRLILESVASKNGETQTGSCRPGFRMGLEMFDGLVDPKAVGREASRQATVMAGAGYCPAGVMPVAIGNGFGGVIFHEACGHSLEASAVAYGMSEFCGKLGQVVANPKVTAIDDATIPNAWGSINFDDEGTPAQRKVLIDKGVLKGYMIDKMGGRRMNMAPTGSARRQSYAYVTTSRMSNTYIDNGTDNNDDIIASIDNGLFAAHMGGGSVNPATGEFNFAVQEGYMIRGGKICEPVRGASLVGKGSEIIKNIDMVGTNLLLGQGMCGSSSGSIPTNVGQPLIRVSSITVGGR